ncbi:MAG: ATP-binding cassette domain-containing protein, partial [Rhodospirillaceae bacterium]
MELFRLLRLHASVDLRRLGIMTFLAGISTTMILAIVNEAVMGSTQTDGDQQQGGETGFEAIQQSLQGVLASSMDYAATDGGGGDGPSLRLAMMFIAAIGLYIITQRWVMATSAREVETLVGSLRKWIFEDARAADLQAMERLGTGPIYAGLTQETQTISRNLPIMVIGAQQIVMLVCVGAYMAILSTEAFFAAVGFLIIAVVVHIKRMEVHNARMVDAHREEAKVFAGLGHLLDGFKEIRVSRARAEGVMGDLALASGSTRVIKTQIKAGWAFEFVLFQLAFYLLLAIMVFVVPMFTEDFHDVIVPASTAALFMIGPVGVVAQAIPMLADSDRAVRNVEALRAHLKQALAEGEDEAAEEIEGPLRSVRLEDATFSYVDGQGRTGFSVGPLSATFTAGSITFVTGGNGSGKSTMMRLVTALARPREGSMLVNDTPLRPGQRQDYRDRIGAIFSDFHLFRRAYGLEDSDPDLVAKLLEEFGLSKKTRFEDGAFSTIDLSNRRSFETEWHR